MTYYGLCRLENLCSVSCAPNGHGRFHRGSAGSSQNAPNRQRRCWVPLELVPRDALRGSAGTVAAGVALVVKQAKRYAKRSPGAVAGWSGNELGTLSVLRSRRWLPIRRCSPLAPLAWRGGAWRFDAPRTRREGQCLLRLPHWKGTSRRPSRPYAAAGSFSSGDLLFCTSSSTARLRSAQSARRSVPRCRAGICVRMDL